MSINKIRETLFITGSQTHAVKFCVLKLTRFIRERKTRNRKKKNIKEKEIQNPTEDNPHV